MGKKYTNTYFYIYAYPRPTNSIIKVRAGAKETNSKHSPPLLHEYLFFPVTYFFDLFLMLLLLLEGSYGAF